MIDSPKCDHCNMGSNESPLHYFLECTAYGPARLSLLSDIKIILPTKFFHKNKLLCEILINGSIEINLSENIKILERTCQFLNETGRFG